MSTVVLNMEVDSIKIKEGILKEYYNMKVNMFRTELSYRGFNIRFGIFLKQQFGCLGKIFSGSSVKGMITIL